MEAILTRCQIGRRFMGRRPIRNDKDLIQSQLRNKLPQNVNMTIVDRIESP